MTIDEAIARERKSAKSNREAEALFLRDDFIWNAKEERKFAEEHEQLAEWLEKLKHYQLGDCMNNCEHYDDCANYIYSKGYNKAIDEFVERLKENSIRGAFEYKPDKTEPWRKERKFCRVVGTRKIDKIAEQMKGGAK